MYKDIAIKKDTNGNFDFVLDSTGDLLLTTNFDSQVYCALFTNARADETEIPIASQREGWIGNLINTNNDRQLGSKMWLFFQTRNLENVANEIKNKSYNSLKYLIEDGFVKNIEIETIRSFKKLELKIKLISFSKSVNEYLFSIWEGFGE